ncbi:hypothetical protein [Sphaerospermopsis aphanizomenoides]|uniref:hypothetical protein n=1 Tax=Sphaerospermopsis aphanizomenoides TaxID=459663 RepID=UPI001905B715|nr:hypothetical protein [Sphaerospermopsis aphanizomenoides]
MKDKTFNPWVVYLRRVRHTTVLGRFPNLTLAQERVRELCRRVPDSRKKIGVYFERPNPAPIKDSRVSENAANN